MMFFISLLQNPPKLVRRLVLYCLGLVMIGSTGLCGPWQLLWSDEFNGTNLSSTNWTFDIGNGQGGWGNNELEYYTSRTNNAFVSGGLLHIVARKESFSGFNYTSAR